MDTPRVFVKPSQGGIGEPQPGYQTLQRLHCGSLDRDSAGHQTLPIYIAQEAKNAIYPTHYTQSTMLFILKFKNKPEWTS